MQSQKVCFNFTQRGSCSYGNSCRFLHQYAEEIFSGGGSYGGGRWAGGRNGYGGWAPNAQYSLSAYQEQHYQAASRSYSTGYAVQPVLRSFAREWSAPPAEEPPDALNFSFMSWNILAAELANTHASELYPHAPPHILAWPQRLAAVVHHVNQHRPDVLCLQEVDDWAGLRAALSDRGYDGVHLQRTGGRGDGCATLWLRDRLTLARPKSRGSKSPAADVGALSSSLNDNSSRRQSTTNPRSATGQGSGSGTEQESGPGTHGGAVHRIRMADHGLRDNVALLVHLRPRRGRERDEVGGIGGPIDAGKAVEGPAWNRMDSRAARPAGSSPEAGRVDSGSSDTEVGAQKRKASKRMRQSGDRTGHAEIEEAGDDEEADSGGATGLTRWRSTRRLPKTCRRGFWVANTHVLFNTKRGDIKLGQLRVIVSELVARAAAAESGATAVKERQQAAEAVQVFEEQEAPLGEKQKPLPVIFAGDFNAAPGSGLYRFLCQGELALAGEDRRDLSGQVEGYGYPSLQRDAQMGQTPQLVRWVAPQQGPATPTQAAASNAASEALQKSMPSASSAAESWYQERSRDGGQARQGSEQGRLQPTSSSFGTVQRTYRVRWEMEELVYAMGRVAVAAAMAAATTTTTVSAAASGSAVGDGAVAAAVGGDPGTLRARQRQNSLQQQEYGRGLGRRGGGSGSSDWHALAPAAVVRHPLRLRSAYAAVDPQRREPLFTTMHARYVGTVDFVWYTPGQERADDDADGRNAAAGSIGSQRASASSPSFSLVPLRVLNPPDPLAYPSGMPCEQWPSDHVSLVVDFQLR